MKYFITEEQRKNNGGTCYFEFQKGQEDTDYKFICWKNDSMLMHVDIADEIRLHKLFDGFDYYGITIVDREKWENFKHSADEELVYELNDWAEENFRQFDYFVILGL